MNHDSRTGMFIDDDFWPSDFNSLYESWLNDRDTVHALADYPVYWNSLRWRFDGSTLNYNGVNYREPVSIHTGFTWLGVGSIVKKSLVQHFLNHQLPLIPLARHGLADNYFSFMTNRLPTLIIVPLYTENLDQSHPYSATQHIVDTLDMARKEAVALVLSGKISFLPTVTGKKKTYTSSQEIKTSMKAATSVRAFDTRFQGWYVLSRTFMTNIKLKEISSTSTKNYQSDSQYDKKLVWDYLHTSESVQNYVDARKNMWHGNKYIQSPYQPYYNAKQISEFAMFESHPPLHAIDQDNLDGSPPATFWESLRPIQKHDWFGLDLGEIKFSMNELVVKAEKEVREMKLEISSDGITWIAFTLMHKLKDKLCFVSTSNVKQEWKFKFRHVQTNTPSTNCHEMRYDLRRIQGRYIRFVADWDFGASLKVWDMRIEHVENDLINMKETIDYQGRKGNGNEKMKQIVKFNEAYLNVYFGGKN